MYKCNRMLLRLCLYWVVGHIGSFSYSFLGVPPGFKVFFHHWKLRPVQLCTFTLDILQLMLENRDTCSPDQHMMHVTVGLCFMKSLQRTVVVLSVRKGETEASQYLFAVL